MYAGQLTSITNHQTVFFRKYRAIFVDGKVLPYHLAISPHWLVHYFSADMEAHPWKLDEELAYLEDARAVVGDRAWTVLSQIGQRMGPHYCGADFSLLPDGRVLLFEANATMLVHPEEEHAVTARKNSYVSRIFAAFDDLIRRNSLKTKADGPSVVVGCAYLNRPSAALRTL